MQNELNHFPVSLEVRMEVLFPPYRALPLASLARAFCPLPSCRVLAGDGELREGEAVVNLVFPWGIFSPSGSLFGIKVGELVCARKGGPACSWVSV